jgi:hypothetical protein
MAIAIFCLIAIAVVLVLQRHREDRGDYDQYGHRMSEWHNDWDNEEDD